MKRHYLLFGTQLYTLSILRPIQKVIKKRGDEVAWFMAGPGRNYLNEDERLLKTVPSVKRYQPRAVFVPGNVVPDFFPGVKVEIFHGFHARKRPADRGHYRIRSFFDLYCTQGPDTTRKFEILAEKYKYFDVVETGWPKMDPLFENEIPPEPNNPPVVFFTSTFSSSLSAALPLFETISKLSSKKRWQWIVNFHPKMDVSVLKRYQSIQSEYLKVIETDDIIPLLKKADVMLSDTSSIISEFLLLQKPVVTYRNRRPGPHLLDFSSPNKIEESIETALSRPESLMQAIKRYTDEIHPYRDGCSSQRVLKATDNFIEKRLPSKPRKPFNLIRRIKIRHQLKYYRWK